MFLKEFKFPVVFAHLENSRFSYLEHFRNNFVSSVSLMYGSITTMIHGICPPIFAEMETNTCKNLLRLIEQRDKESTKRRYNQLEGGSDV